jgi:carboxylesterase type B
MFSIHGGGFIAGNVQSLRPDYFMDHKVILVTVQYRLGPFGFLNAGVPGAAGNQGLKDLVLALKWVQGNIQRFGGDPEKVTLNGGVAGAYAVSYLTLSPLATGIVLKVV